jgi:uncharacterized protein YbjT (DUF2867 family)
LSRTPERLEDRIGATVEAVGGDLEDRASLAAAFEGVDAAYYLAHSLGTDADFAERERRAAVNFAEAAAAAGVGRIVYLGGLGDGDDELSPHLAARHEVGQILRESPVPTVELRASIVIGPGSASYDLLQLIVENVPVAVVPGWTRTLAQPIHVDDVVSYLVAALDVELDASRIYEVGGPEPISYLDLMRAYADVRGLDRAIVPVPAFVPPGADLMQGLIEAAAPERVTLWLRLLESMRNDTAVHDDAARRDFPELEPRGVEQALRDAVAAASPA